MSGKWKTVVRLAFRGKRFQDHALDVNALREVIQYQRVVEETAKSLWKSENPNRERLPKRFEDRVRLYLRTIEDGSAVAPLDVFFEEQEQAGLFLAEPPELLNALSVSQQVYEALTSDGPLPSRFPRQLIDDYARFGEGLLAGESVEIALTTGPVARVSESTRASLLARADKAHETDVELAGIVLEADVRQDRFQLWTDERTSVTVHFSPEQEDVVTTALREHRRTQLRIQGRAEMSSDGKPLRVSRVQRLDLRSSGIIAFRSDVPPIEDVLATLAAEVSLEDWKTLPDDLAGNLDHYIYGTPRE